MGFTGLVSYSIDPSIRPDLSFFIITKRTNCFLIFSCNFSWLALTISTIDTLINAISSLIVVDGKATFNLNKKINYLRFPNTS